MMTEECTPEPAPMTASRSRSREQLFGACTNRCCEPTRPFSVSRSLDFAFRQEGGAAARGAQAADAEWHRSVAQAHNTVVGDRGHSLRSSGPPRTTAYSYGWLAPDKEQLARSLPLADRTNTSSSGFASSAATIASAASAVASAAVAVASAAAAATGVVGSGIPAHHAATAAAPPQQPPSQPSSSAASASSRPAVVVAAASSSAAASTSSSTGHSASTLPPADAAGGGGGAGDCRRVEEAACHLLERVVCECVDSSARPERVFAPIFHSVSVPGISGSDYLLNHLLRLGLARKEHLSHAVLLHAFLLIDRLLHSQSASGFHLCTRNVHRVLLATTLVSAKLLDDECYNNAYWASVGGVSLTHLNQLEVELIKLLHYNLHVTADALEAARVRLLDAAA